MDNLEKAASIIENLYNPRANKSRCYSIKDQPTDCDVHAVAFWMSDNMIMGYPVKQG